MPSDSERLTTLFNLANKLAKQAEATIVMVETALDRNQLASATRILELFGQDVAKKEEDFSRAMSD